MTPFEYQRASDVSAAVGGAAASSKFLGGTNLIDLMKNGVERPARLIDINRVSLAVIETLPGGGVRLGALARNSDTANHPLVRQGYPLISQAILSGASPQLRNLATNGGNLLQRTRCPYFMDTGFSQCNKRAPGTGCGAIHGFHRMHAIFGASDSCIAVHPSDLCVALAALDATVRVQGPAGERQIPFRDFHRLPGATPERDTNLQPGELILSIDLPPSPYAAHSHYLKVRDRASYDFALVSVAAALELDSRIIRGARIALGGVAHKPWRAESAERLLAGRNVSPDTFEAPLARPSRAPIPTCRTASKSTGPALHSPRALHRRRSLMSKPVTIGDPLPRVDGRAKVTGTARYTAEFPVAGLAYAALVTASIPSGRVRIESAEAAAAPGVLAVVTPANALRLLAPERRLTLLQDDRVFYSPAPPRPSATQSSTLPANGSATCPSPPTNS